MLLLNRHFAQSVRPVWSFCQASCQTNAWSTGNRRQQRLCCPAQLV